MHISTAATNFFFPLITSLPSMGCNVIKIHINSHRVLFAGRGRIIEL
jgi:hypothetical protein